MESSTRGGEVCGLLTSFVSCVFFALGGENSSPVYRRRGAIGSKRGGGVENARGGGAAGA
eukprot:6196360-Pleurochrysis_carterae.AAC.1